MIRSRSWQVEVGQQADTKEVRDDDDEPQLLQITDQDQRRVKTTKEE